MLQNFEAMVHTLRRGPKRTVSVAAPEAREIIQVLQLMHEQGLMETVLAGDKKKIEALRQSCGATFPIKHLEDTGEDENAAAQESVRLIADGRADILMKGNLKTSSIVSALLNKAYGLRTDRPMSHIFILECKPCNRLLFVADSAINIAPDLERKKAILQNTLDFCNRLGYQQPKAAILAAVEYVSDKMPVTIDAQALTAMAGRGEIRGGIVHGPLALDDALSPWVCAEKGVEGPIQGDADILLVPNIEAGNMFSKAQTFLAGGPLAGVAVGAKVPMVLNSRADSVENRYFAMTAAALAVG